MLFFREKIHQNVTSDFFGYFDSKIMTGFSSLHFQCLKQILTEAGILELKIKIYTLKVDIFKYIVLLKILENKFYNIIFHNLLRLHCFFYQM